MLIHITPKFLSCRFSGPAPQLEKIDIPAFGYIGLHGDQIDTRKPFPNKLYSVGCRKQGKKAVSGFIFDIDTPPEHFEVICHWGVPNFGTITHKIDYFINDRELDAVSDAMLLWAMPAENGLMFENRFIDLYANTTPAQACPRMAFTNDKGKTGEFEDLVEAGMILSRKETFIMPSIEKERLMGEVAESIRIPDVKNSIKVGS